MLSLRYKIPLRITALVVICCAVVSVSLMVRAFEVFRGDLRQTAANFANILSRSLIPSLLHDDPWQAYETITRQFGFRDSVGGLGAEFVLVLDRDGKVFASNQPVEYPLASPVDDAAPHKPRLDAIFAAQPFPATQQLHGGTLEGLYVVTPISTDAIPLGVLVMGYTDQLIVERFWSFANRAGTTTLALIVLLLLPAIWWGAHYARPLLQLADCMKRLGRQETPIDSLEVPDVHGDDELSLLGERFRDMIEELQGKAALERQVIVVERLAAIGRFTAGIAHEINNPLGGMLNSISTLKKHGQLDPLAIRTIQLIERGLLQIKETVSALLVEARTENHPLSSADIDDVHTLVSSEASRRRVTLHWESSIDDEVDLPSTLVRQTLINLLLNAIQACPEKSEVSCRIAKDAGSLRLAVHNDGPRIDEHTLAHLFEPFATTRANGRGLGLWVTYQIVTGLDGSIEVTSEPGGTAFLVQLPLETRAAA